MNVLKSYKLDSGVDAVLRENLSEVHEVVCVCFKHGDPDPCIPNAATPARANNRIRH